MSGLLRKLLGRGKNVTLKDIVGPYELSAEECKRAGIWVPPGCKAYLLENGALYIMRGSEIVSIRKVTQMELKALGRSVD